MSTNVTEITHAVSGLQVEGPPQTDVFNEENTVSFNGGPPIPLADLQKDHEPLRDALFNRDSYIDVPVIDGQATDKLRIGFAGTIEYPAGDPDGRAMFDSLTLGKGVELRVSGVVVGKAGAWKIAGAGGDLEREVVTGAVKVKVESLYTLAPEDM